jgi:Kef-type K+ transport system membrane component KefB
MDSQNKLEESQKWTYSFIAAVVVAIVFLPATFRFVKRYLFDFVADSNGVPTWQGVLVHIVVATALLRLVMYIMEKTGAEKVE